MYSVVDEREETGSGGSTGCEDGDPLIIVDIRVVQNEQCAHGFAKRGSQSYLVEAEKPRFETCFEQEKRLAGAENARK